MTTVLDQIGGETAMRDLVARFYDLVETLPEGEDILSQHLQNHGLSHTRVEQFEFLRATLRRVAMILVNDGQVV